MRVVRNEVAKWIKGETEKTCDGVEVMTVCKARSESGSNQLALTGVSMKLETYLMQTSEIRRDFPPRHRSPILSDIFPTHFLISPSFPQIA